MYLWSIELVLGFCTRVCVLSLSHLDIHTGLYVYISLNEFGLVTHHFDLFFIKQLQFCYLYFFISHMAVQHVLFGVLRILWARHMFKENVIFRLSKRGHIFISSSKTTRQDVLIIWLQLCRFLHVTGLCRFYSPSQWRIDHQNLVPKIRISVNNSNDFLPSLFHFALLNRNS